MQRSVESLLLEQASVYARLYREAADDRERVYCMEKFNDYWNQFTACIQSNVIREAGQPCE